MQITLTVTETVGMLTLGTAVSNGPAFRRSVPRDRFARTVAPESVCAVTPPMIWMSLLQVGITSTSGVEVHAVQE
ncbi:hypothetical protein ASF39_15430 [Methylobacterium sp. Leaf108]|nr:hypothetical protein ASF39_15430 [Methylobacterium sp. Leaf108]